MVLPQWGVKCFYETFVGKRTAVLLLNFGAKIPPLRQYPNRCQQCFFANSSTNNELIKPNRPCNALL